MNVERVRPLHHRDVGEETLAALNRKIANRLVGSGSFFLAPTLLEGKTSLRVAIVNFRTSESDLVALLDEAARVGRDLASR